MRRPTRDTWVAIASILSILVGVVWIASIVRSERAGIASMHLVSGETVTMEYEAGDPHQFSSAERAAIADAARQTIPDVRRVLPAVPSSIVLRVKSATKDKVIPETGENASNGQPNIIDWRVDTSRKEGVAAIARAQLRPTLFHELHHLARTAEVLDHGIRDDVIREGLATAFERDFAGAAPPWGQFPVDVDAWVREVLALPNDAPRDAWLFQHPDGRRWVGYRVGTLVVDCAMRSSGKTSAELVRVPTNTIVGMCPMVAPRRDGGSSN